MSVVVPFSSDDRAYTFNCTLNGISYTFDVQYNERDGIWYFDLYLATSDTPLASSIPILLGGNILSAYAYLGIGGLFAVDMGAASSKGSPSDTTENVLVSADAGPDDLGTRVIVVYLTPDEVAAATLAGANSSGLVSSVPTVGGGMALSMFSDAIDGGGSPGTFGEPLINGGHA